MPGRPRAYNAVLDSQGYLIAGGQSGAFRWGVEQIPSEMGTDKPPGDKPERISTNHLGFGYGESYVPGCYHLAVNMDWSQPGVGTMGALVSTATVSTTALGGSAINGFFLANGEWYVLCGRFCKRLSVSSSAVTAETPNNGSDGKDFGPGHVASDSIEWKGNRIIGFSSDHPIWQLASNTWSQADPDTTATKTISDATNAAPIVITTTTTHGRSTGDIVTISSVGGNTDANGTWAITVLTTTTFSLTGSTGNGAYTSGGTMAVATTIKAERFAKDWIDGLDWRLWRVIRGTVTIDSNNDDPLEADNWGSDYTVGDSGSAITAFAGSDQSLFIAKTDGLYMFDWTTRATNRMQSVQQLVNSNNGKNMLVDVDRVYFPHEMGLLEYNWRDGGIRSVQPGAATANSLPPQVTSGVTGRVTAQAKLGAWHYVAVYNGTDSFLCKGREPAGESVPAGWVGPIIWHPFVKLSSAEVTAMAIQGSVSPARLWFGYTSSTNYVAGFITIPKSGNHLAESGITWAPSGSTYFSPLDFQVPGVPKELIGFDIENVGFATTSKTVSGATNASPIVITTSTAHGLATADTVVITGVLGNTAANGTFRITSVTSTTFSLDGSTGNGTYTSGGTVAANMTAALYISLDDGNYAQWGSTASTAGRTQLTLPSGTWRSYQTRMRLDVVNYDASTTVKIKPIVARAAPRPAYRDYVTTEILCRDDMRLRDGSPERKTGQALLDLLHALRSAGPKTLTYYWTGSAVSKTVLVHSVTEQMIEQRGNDPAGWGVVLTFEVLGDA